MITVQWMSVDEQRRKLQQRWEFEDPEWRARRRVLRRLLVAALAAAGLATAVTAWVSATADDRAARRAQRAAVIADLHRLSGAQEAFFAQHGRYGSLAEFGVDYLSSQGVRVRVDSAGVTGWVARAWHLQADIECRGRVARQGARTAPLELECR